MYQIHPFQLTTDLKYYLVRHYHPVYLYYYHLLSLFLPIASISSIKIIDGYLCLACLNRSFIFLYLLHDLHQHQQTFQQNHCLINRKKVHLLPQHMLLLEEFFLYLEGLLTMLLLVILLLDLYIFISF